MVTHAAFLFEKLYHSGRCTFSPSIIPSTLGNPAMSPNLFLMCNRSGWLNGKWLHLGYYQTKAVLLRWQKRDPVTQESSQFQSISCLVFPKSPKDYCKMREGQFYKALCTCLWAFARMYTHAPQSLSSFISLKYEQDLHLFCQVGSFYVGIKCLFLANICLMMTL